MLGPNARATGSSLAASVAIHAIALGALVLAARSPAPEPDGGVGNRGAGASGDVVRVRLLEISSGPSHHGVSADAPTAEARTRSIPPQPLRTVGLPRQAEPRRGAAAPASATRAEADQRPSPRTQGPPAAALQTRAPAGVASASASPPQRLTRPDAASGSSPPQPVIGMPAGGSGPAGGRLPSVALGAGSGSDAGQLDRAARPAVPILPRYPARARQRGDEADVEVEVWVGARGDVDRVAVSRSAGAEFDAAALAAVRRARFHPAIRQGMAVPSRVALRLHFRLDR